MWAQILRENLAVNTMSLLMWGRMAECRGRAKEREGIIAAGSP